MSIVHLAEGEVLHDEQVIGQFAASSEDHLTQVKGWGCNITTVEEIQNRKIKKHGGNPKVLARKPALHGYGQISRPAVPAFGELGQPSQRLAIAGLRPPGPALTLLQEPLPIDDGDPLEVSSTALVALSQAAVQAHE